MNIYEKFLIAQKQAEKQRTEATTDICRRVCEYRITEIKQILHLIDQNILISHEVVKYALAMDNRND